MKKDEQIQIFCQNIKIIRKENGLSKKEMAKILDIGISSLTNLEQGTLPLRIGAEIIFRLSNNFNIKPDMLFISF